MSRATPAIAGVLTAEQVTATGAAIVGMQEDSGALPWFPGGQTDPWDHIESAMALSVTGFLAEAEAAYDWSRRHQRPDGSWPIRTVRGTVTDHGIDSNFCAYIAVGVWHHYMITGDTAFLDRMWPTVWSAIDLVCRFQRPDGAFRWGGDHRTHAMFDEASSPATRASTTPSTARSGSPRRSTSPTTSGCVRSRRSGGIPRADRGLRGPSEHSMDWYYPVLGGALRGRAGQELIARRWDEFVVPGKGVRCVDHGRG